MERIPSPSCFNWKFSSSNFSPKIDLPPVPFWFVKSPPWHMNPGITRWKGESLNPKPFSPVQSALKFSAVLGVTSPLISIVMRPAGSPPISISKKVLNLSLCLTSRRSRDTSSMSKFSVFPASGWLQSRVHSVSLTSLMVAVMPCPTINLDPTTVYSSPTASITSCFGTFITFAGLISPYASFGTQFKVFNSPIAMPMTPLSKPGIIMPPPTVNEMGSPRSRELSNCSPSSRVPT
mmetsp:Transcript_169/g.522  ORF Transcript_169/g.522 Transcript_169/m.522 type:complete len:235 (-) Transcript_169:270-974(-)